MILVYPPGLLATLLETEPNNSLIASLESLFEPKWLNTVLLECVVSFFDLV